MLSTHVLDTSRGLPASGIEVILYRLDGADGEEIASATTDENGRASFDPGVLTDAFYELEFITGPYFEGLTTPSFYDVITVRFRVDATAQKYHVPLLLAPYGYSTYLGS